MGAHRTRAQIERRTEIQKEWRENIRVGVIINRLQNHALGKIKMQSTEIRAAEVVLDRALPRLSSSDTTVRHIRSVAELTDDELAAIAGESGVDAAGGGARIPDPVH